MDGRKDSAHTKKHCSDGKESRIGLTGPCPLRALPIVRPDVLARRRQRQREFTSELVDQEENSISTNSPKLICTNFDDYSIEPPSKILCGNPYGGIKKVEVASPKNQVPYRGLSRQPYHLPDQCQVRRLSTNWQLKSNAKVQAR
jgi:hypothetical protein